MPGPYDDILHLPRPVSKKHPPMPMGKRAAQFLPFAALTGFEGEIAETGRLTEAAPELGEDALVALDRQLALLRQRLPEQPEVTIVRFVPDEKKDGGQYETLTGRVRRLDEPNRVLILTDHRGGADAGIVNGKNLSSSVDRGAGETLQYKG